jgi:hypothetical protein
VVYSWLVAFLINSNAETVQNISVVGPLSPQQCAEMQAMFEKETPKPPYRTVHMCQSFSAAFNNAFGCRLLEAREPGGPETLTRSWKFGNCRPGHVSTP